MCGWIAATNDPSWFSGLAQASHICWEGKTIRPTQACPVICLSTHGPPEVHPAHWGLVPRGCKDPRHHRHTCEAPTHLLTHHRSFKTPFQTSRVLVPVHAFQPHHGGKWTTSRTGPGLMLAGLADTWSGPEGSFLSFAIVTCTTPSGTMPVVLGQRAARMWLNAETPTGELLKLLVPCPAHWLEQKG